jgi:hypothetical protein
MQIKNIIKLPVILGAFSPFLTSALAQSVLPPKIFTPQDFAETITASEMKEKMLIIAGDDFEGRETGDPGQKKCGIFLAEHFKKLGLQPVINSANQPKDSLIKSLSGWKAPDGLSGYMQAFPMREEKISVHKLTINGKNYTFLEDYFAFQGIPDNVYESDKIVFVGFGIYDKKRGINEYKGLDVRGKAVAFFEDEPMDRKGNSLVTGTPKLSEWTTDLKLKTEAARQAGAIAVVSIQKHAGHDMEMYRQFIEKPGTYQEGKRRKAAFPKFFISEKMADEILATENKKYSTQFLRDEYRNGNPGRGFVMDVPFRAEIKTEKRIVTGENILGFIEGTDLKHEIIVITAHYDHLGKTDEGIYYGADDDGSGTVTLMELAEAFVFAKNNGFGPRRSILIMPVSGEEKGLLGSQYYSENPVFPIKNTIANLNIDMIGRVDKNHEGNFNYVYIIGSDRLSQDLHDINEETNKKHSGLEFDYTFNDPKDTNQYYYRSDHYNFAKMNVPVIFYFTGVHEDYHRITDTPDKLHYEKMQKIARHIFYTAWELANRQERPRLNN